jgi:alanine racemase
MFRLGFLGEEVPELVKRLKGMPELVVQSVFSHLAGSDEAQHDGFTQDQFSLFEQACKVLEEGLRYPFMRHILNSGGVERFPNHQYEMVRLGIGLYGVSAVGEADLKNVTTLKTYISQSRLV